MFCKYFLAVCDLSFHSFHSQYFLTPLERLRGPWQTCCLTDFFFLTAKQPTKVGRVEMFERNGNLRNQDGGVAAASLSSRKPTWITSAPGTLFCISALMKHVKLNSASPRNLLLSGDLMVPLSVD